METQWIWTWANDERIVHFCTLIYFCHSHNCIPGMAQGRLYTTYKLILLHYYIIYIEAFILVG